MSRKTVAIGRDLHPPLQWDCAIGLGTPKPPGSRFRPFAQRPPSIDPRRLASWPRYLRTEPTKTAEFVEEVQISGHIIDSLILPKVLDLINAGRRHVSHQADFGRANRNRPELRADRSRRRQRRATRRDPGPDQRPRRRAHRPARLPAGGGRHRRRVSRGLLQHHQPADRSAPGRPMDRSGRAGNGLRRRRRYAKQPTARCVAMTDVQAGMPFVVGHAGVRVFPEERSTEHQAFEFMNSARLHRKAQGRGHPADRPGAVSSTRPSGGQTLLVGGPAIVHTGSGEHVCRLIRGGYINKLFAGNALATHDIEQALFGTSLGVHLERGDLAEAGHEHHLRAINRIRRAGRHSPGRAKRAADLRHHVRMRAATTSISCWPAAFATTGPCPR